MGYWYGSCDFSGEEEDDMERSIGNGKMFPLGPECTFNNKQAPTFCCCSENGSITSELLTKMLAHIDNCGIFDQSDGVAPFLLFDGHGSWFELEVLEYADDVNDEGHRWTVCIGVPYGTSYWQVGDSMEQNGSFKIALSHAKTELLQKKAQVSLEYAIKKSNVMPIVKAAWEKSFA